MGGAAPSFIFILSHNLRLLPPSFSSHFHHHHRTLFSSFTRSSSLTPKLKLKASQNQQQQHIHTQPSSSPLTGTHHPWPEFSRFLSHISSVGYTSAADGFPSTGELSPAEVSACLTFARDRPNLLRLLSMRDVAVVVEHGTPFMFSDSQDSVWKMKSFLSNGDSTALDSDKANMVDLMKFMLSYASSCLVSSERNNIYNRNLVESSVRNLFSELFKLSYSAPGPNSFDSVQNQMPGGRFGSTMPPGQNIEMKGGDWICPRCNFMNFARHIKCLVCEEARPKRQLTGGEWECPQCDFHNFGRNVACLQCDCKRPGQISLGSTNTKSHPGYGNVNNSNASDIDARLVANEEKAQRWFNKVSQLDNNSDINSVVDDEDFPEIMPLRKGVNRFVVSTRKIPLERRLTNAQYKRNLGNNDAPEVEDFKTGELDKSHDTLDDILGRSTSLPRSDYKNMGAEQSFSGERQPSTASNTSHFQDVTRNNTNTLPPFPSYASSGDTDNTQLSNNSTSENVIKDKEKEQAEKSEGWFRNIAELNDVPDITSTMPPGQNIEMKGGDWICPRCNFMNFARNIKCLVCEEARPKRQLTGGEWECPQCDFHNFGRNVSCLQCDCKRPGQISLGSTNTKSHPGYGNVNNSNASDIDARLVANEEKAQRWFNKVSQLDNNSDINSVVDDEDFPEIMPLRKGVNRFVVSTRKIPLERRLTNAQYKRNLGNNDAPEVADFKTGESDKSHDTLDDILGRSTSLPRSDYKNMGAEQSFSGERQPSTASNTSHFQDVTRNNTNTLPPFPSYASSGGTDNTQLSNNSTSENVIKDKEKEQAEKSEGWFRKIAELNDVPDITSTMPPGQNIEMKGGDWICPRCNFMNFARNIKCLVCEEARSKRQLTGGEWKCPQCDFHNFGRNVSCLPCDCKRPGQISLGSTNTKSHPGYGNVNNSNASDIDARLVANEEKAQRWFNKVSQLDNNSDINSVVDDEDFPEIMPLRKGVNRFVVSTRKIPLERRLTNAQYKRNLGNNDAPEVEGFKTGESDKSHDTLDDILGRSTSLPRSDYKNMGAEQSFSGERQPSTASNTSHFQDVTRNNTNTLPPFPSYASSGDTHNTQLSNNSTSENVIKDKEKEQAEKSEGWFRKVAELNDVPDITSAISDDDFPEIMPMRKGENRFVVSKKKDRSLTTSAYKRRLAMDQSGNNNFVPFVPFPPDYFAKKDKPQADVTDSTDTSNVKSSSISGNNNFVPFVPFPPDYFAKKDKPQADVTDSTDTSNVKSSSISEAADMSGHARFRAEHSPESSSGQSSSNSNHVGSIYGATSSGNSSQGFNQDHVPNLIENSSSGSASENQSVGTEWTGKSLEGSAVREPDPLDMSEEAKADRWFRLVAQIKDIYELRNFLDKDFPSIMPYT